MSTRRYIAWGSVSVLAIAGGLLAVPTSRHFIRHEVARHTHYRFGTTTATSVVPVPKALPDGGLADADLRFAPAASAARPLSRLVPPTLEAAHFGAAVAAAGNAAAPASPLERSAAQEARPATQPANPLLEADLANARQALRLYRQGDVAAADDFARLTSGPLRTLLDWAAIRLAPWKAGATRMATFNEAHVTWPTRTWIARRIEEAKAGSKDPALVLALFATQEPDTLLGKLALARADIATGKQEAGQKIVQSIWRNDDLTATEEATILKEFGSVLRRDDYKFRADRLLYAETVPQALRSAVLAGPDVAALAKARVAVIGSTPSDTLIAAVAKPLQSDPGLIFSRIQKARRANKISDAAALMLAAPTDPALLIDGDAWWVERRLIARKLLDQGDPKTAYRICAAHSATSKAMRLEAEFHAGWIALRFLNDPAEAAPHFGAMTALAEAPISIARAAYWEGRAAAAAQKPTEAVNFYAQAAEQPTTFYGQLARAELKQPATLLRQPSRVAVGDDRHEAIRVVELLFGLGERDLALNLSLSITKTEPDEGQVAALAAAVAATGDARATLTIGKAAAQRGMPLDDAAFPTFGIPGYQPLSNSADRSTVYAIARQESEFDPRSVSAAGAKGLMQLIASTAKQTAEKAGVDFSETRLLTDASFNAQIGAAHLGKLLSDEDGSYILTFAAYNAGSRRVQEWIDAYGDPRKLGVDPVDWIERIPFTETRNYVQRVFENMQMYRTRFGMPSAFLSDAQRPAAGKGT